MDDDVILQVERVFKRYGDKVAVDDLSMRVPANSIFGLLGPNGAGKTSLIRMITGITQPDEGRICFRGESAAALRHPRIGYLPEERGLYRKMKVGEHLLYLGQLRGMTYQEAETKSRNWLDKFGLSDRWNRRVEELSKGMQQQVQFVATVLHEPSILILDEPFSGLDPVNTNRLKEEILLLRRRGVSIIFSTHRMEQVEEICDYIALISQGRNVLEGPLDDVRRRFRRHHYRIGFQGELPADFAGQFQVIDELEQAVTVAWPEERSANELLAQLIRRGIQVQSFHEVLPSLNEIFIRQVSSNPQLP